MGICHIFSASGFRAGEELVGKSLIGAEDADVDVGEGNDDGAGESSGVDEMRCAKHAWRSGCHRRG